MITTNIEDCEDGILLRRGGSYG